jgi:hypothetical protein
MTTNEWRIEVMCTQCGSNTWHRHWEPTNANGVKLTCTECGEDYILPHGIGEALGWMFQIEGVI